MPYHHGGKAAAADGGGGGGDARGAPCTELRLYGGSASEAAVFELHDHNRPTKYLPTASIVRLRHIGSGFWLSAREQPDGATQIRKSLRLLHWLRLLHLLRWLHWLHSLHLLHLLHLPYLQTVGSQAVP